MDPLTLPTQRRVASLGRDGRLFHVILAQQFDRELIGTLCRLADMIRAVADTRQGSDFLRRQLCHRRAMLYFTQPSTRTFLSFAAACQIMGMPYNEVRDPKTSSEVKGESEEDAIRVFSQYFDIVVMRHPAEGFAERVAHALNGTRRPIPLVNGGAGKDQHPTQALLDIYTLHRAMAPPYPPGRPDFSGNPFDGKTVAFVGDLKRGRTVRSLVYLLTRYPGVRMLFIAPDELQIGDDIVRYIRRYGVRHDLRDDLGPSVAECDAIYMTRMQDEHDSHGESATIDYSRFHLTAGMSDSLKPDAAILHPLPRRHELDASFDTDPRARYWGQVRNGMWMRAALMAYIFHVDAAVIDHYYSECSD